MTRLKRPGLVLVFWLAAIGLLWGDEVGTNNLIRWPARSTPEEIGRKAMDYMLPRWQPADPADPSAQDFIVLLQFAGKTGDGATKSQLLKRIDPLLKQVEENPGCLQRRVDHSVFGAVLLEIYLQTGNSRCLTLGKRLADRQWEEPRTDGLSSESRFRVEDMYLISALQVRAFQAARESVYLDRAARTLSVYCDKLQDGNGLFHHGVGAPLPWGRGNGYAAISLAMLLNELPPASAERTALMTAYQKLMSAVAKHQSSSGMWNQLIDDPKSYAESSATAMLTQALVVGVRNGWLAPDSHVPAARRGWLSLMDKVGQSGKVYQVSVAAEPSPSAEYYRNLPAQRGGREGQSAVLQCAVTLLPQEPVSTGAGR